MEKLPEVSTQASEAPGTTGSRLKRRLPVSAKWLIPLAPLGFLWFMLVRQLQVEWTNNPQYAYGWAVPFLCLGLLWRRWQSTSESDKTRFQAAGTFPSSSFGSRAWLWLSLVVLGLCAFFYLPARLIHESVPLFRPAHWLMAGIVVGITLATVYLAFGAAWLRLALFPVCFIFVAIPWIGPVERFVMHGLARIVALITSELSVLAGIPAVVHGKVIEIGAGLVGINDACSGIRSIQSTLMVGLFLGELYRLSVFRRIILCTAGFILAFLLNIVRTFSMVWIATEKGIAAIDDWHDPAGVSITLGCLFGLWVMGNALRRTAPPEPVASPEREPDGSPDPSPGLNVLAGIPSARLLRYGLGLSFWLLSVEIGTAYWYSNLETPRSSGARWAINWPVDNPSFKQAPLRTSAIKTLRCDSAQQARWSDPAHIHWHVYLLEWFPGRLASYFANRHRPEVCMTAAGYEMVADPEERLLEVNGLKLPFKRYTFKANGSLMFVFYCAWQSSHAPSEDSNSQSKVYDVLRGSWVEKEDLGRQVLEIAVSGFGDSEEAEAALVRQLTKLISVDQAVTTAKAEPGVGQVP